MNWVDRRFSKERNLEDAVEVWNGAINAIHEAVNSFDPDSTKTRLYPQNGHRILVEVEQPEHELAHVYQADTKRRVSIAFDPSTPAITAALDGEAAVVFRIVADENHCYLTHGGVEIDADRFSEIVLEKAFFQSSNTRTVITTVRRRPRFTRA